MWPTQPTKKKENSHTTNLERQTVVRLTNNDSTMAVQLPLVLFEDTLRTRPYNRPRALGDALLTDVAHSSSCFRVCASHTALQLRSNSRRRRRGENVGDGPEPKTHPSTASLHPSTSAPPRKAWRRHSVPSPLPPGHDWHNSR